MIWISLQSPNRSTDHQHQCFCHDLIGYGFFIIVLFSSEVCFIHRRIRFPLSCPTSSFETILSLNFLSCVFTISRASGCYVSCKSVLQWLLRTTETMSGFSMHHRGHPGNVCSIIVILCWLYSMLVKAHFSSKLKSTLSQVWACDSYTYCTFFPNLIPAWCHDNYICMSNQSIQNHVSKPTIWMLHTQRTQNK